MKSESKRRIKIFGEIFYKEAKLTQILIEIQLKEIAICIIFIYNRAQAAAISVMVHWFVLRMRDAFVP